MRDIEELQSPSPDEQEKIERLIHAVSYGTTESVDALLKEGADINGTGTHYNTDRTYELLLDCTPIEAAYTRNRPDMVKHLIDKGANLNIANNSRSSDMESAMIYYITTSNKEMLKFLIDKGAKFPLDSLHKSAHNSDLTIFKLLLTKYHDDLNPDNIDVITKCMRLREHHALSYFQQYLDMHGFKYTPFINQSFTQYQHKEKVLLKNAHPILKGIMTYPQTSYNKIRLELYLCNVDLPPEVIELINLCVQDVICTKLVDINIDETIASHSASNLQQSYNKGRLELYLCSAALPTEVIELICAEIVKINRANILKPASKAKVNEYQNSYSCSTYTAQALAYYDANQLTL